MSTLHLDSPGAFFPPLHEGDQTPEFIRWAIDYHCLPREAQRGDDLEQLFRQLRPLAALGDAFREDRVSADLRATAATNNSRYEFSVREILNFYGASEFKEVTCLNCPTNASSENFPQCIGIISRGPAIEEFVDALNRELESASAPIPDTTPRWYGFWAESPLHGERLQAQAQLLDSVLQPCVNAPKSLVAFQRGLRTAIALSVPVHVQLHPLGIVRAGRWEIPAHCGYCSALRKPRQRVCKICRREKDWKSAEKRRLIGIRPYRAAKAVD
jgi:hypothetical protein